jgi:hypothetical protein
VRFRIVYDGCARITFCVQFSGAYFPGPGALLLTSAKEPISDRPVIDHCEDDLKKPPDFELTTGPPKSVGSL